VICAALAAAQPAAKKIAGPPQPRAEGIVRLFDLIGTEVRKFSALEVVPNSFGRIQVGRISGQPLDFEPVPLLEEEVFIMLLRCAGR
jgi:hypothetical protein